MFRAFTRAAMISTCMALVPAMAGDRTSLWTLTGIDGTLVTFTATLDLSEPGRLSGRAPCNSYGGRLGGDGHAFLPGPILSTKMACDGLADENLYLQALQMVESSALAGDELTLTGEQVLVFTRSAD